MRDCQTEHGEVPVDFHDKDGEIVVFVPVHPCPGGKQLRAFSRHPSVKRGSRAPTGKYWACEHLEGKKTYDEPPSIRERCLPRPEETMELVMLVRASSDSPNL